MEFRIEAKIEPNGTIVLHDLPFHEGDKVMVVITTQPDNPSSNSDYSLRGLPVEYKDPFDPVAESDWGVLS